MLWKWEENPMSKFPFCTWACQEKSWFTTMNLIQYYAGLTSFELLHCYATAVNHNRNPYNSLLCVSFLSFILFPSMFSELYCLVCRCFAYDSTKKCVSKSQCLFSSKWLLQTRISIVQILLFLVMSLWDQNNYWRRSKKNYRYLSVHCNCWTLCYNIHLIMTWKCCSACPFIPSG